MPRGSVGTTEAAGDRGADRLSALPDELLQHTLSFLPSREAVRTCLLARRWRHQWKSVPALRVTDVDAFRSAQRVNDFINYLMVFRDRTTLRECEIAAYREYDDGEEYYDSDGDCCEHSRYTDLWIRYALSCNARLLRLSNHDPDDLYNELEEPTRRVLLAIPIFSRHLMTLELEGVQLSSSYSLDFSSCPNLETLKMNNCSFQILGDGRINISSPSVRCLSITGCDFNHFYQARALISVPSLVYLDLELADDCGLVPAFESMPSVHTASINFNRNFGMDSEGGSLLLGRLSDSTNLELIAKPQVFDSREFLKRCTTFRKLETLSINDWSVEPNFDPLQHFLQRSPSLEKLSVRISKLYRHAKKTDGSYDLMEPVLASKHLRVVEIRCAEKDKRIHKILKVLSSYGVPPEQINVKEKNWSAHGTDSDFELSDYSFSNSEESD